MSRYFKIVISDPKTGQVYVPNAGGQPGFSKLPAISDLPGTVGQSVSADPALSTYTSLNAGSNVFALGGTNPAAQTIELDIPTSAMHTPVTSANFRIWGVGLGEINQAANLNYMNCAVYGGMARGLPLANPAQAGLLVAGQLRQCFGNWVGNSMYLEGYVIPGGGSPTSNQFTGQPSTYNTVPLPSTNEHPANIVFQWKSGPLMQVLVNTLAAAFPRYRIQGAISPNLIWTGAPESGFFSTLEQFARYVNSISLKIIGGYAPDVQSYAGVHIALVHNVLLITDGTMQTSPVAIAFPDLIGQPAWQGPATVQFQTVLRADIVVGDYISLPPSFGVLTPGTNGQVVQVGVLAPPVGTNTLLKNRPTFSGIYLVQSARHVGNSRAADASAWTTVYDVVSAGTASAIVPDLPVLYEPNNAYLFYLPA